MTRKNNHNRITALHRKLCRILEDCGIEYEVEVEKGLYQIDCFSNELNLGFEADGPCHGARRDKDRLRDKYLWKQVGIRVLRLNARVLKNPPLAKMEIQEFVRSAREQDIARFRREVMS
jgi:very-short-patch-repair endonuclease